LLIGLGVVFSGKSALGTRVIFPLSARARQKESLVESIFWLIASPLLFVLPGLFPARMVTGERFSFQTIAWALFFSVVLLPPICFGLAMLLGTVAGPALVLPVGIGLSAIGLIFPKRTNGEDS
jgi:ABC-type molybdate transport system permease subunit